MSKWHVKELSRAWESLLRDACYAYPTLAGELQSRDLPRFRSLCEARGLSWFLTDMPALAKHFERCLAQNKYKSAQLPGSKPVSSAVVIPRFLRGLYLLVFAEDGSLLDEADTQAVFFLRQLLLFAKKVEFECPVRNSIDEVFEFLTIDYALPEPIGIWECDTPGTWTGPLRSFVEATPQAKGAWLIFHKNLDLVSGFLGSALGPYRTSDWSFKHGPGAVSELRGGSNKYLWRSWSARLESGFPVADCGYHSYAAWANDTVSRQVCSKERASRLVCVPKTYSKPRLIAAEPTANQWCQQNCWHYFRSRTQDSWLSSFVRFNDQTRNQELCLEGSRTGMLATLDLSSASDRVSCWAVEALFRSNPPLLRALASSRTRYVELPKNLGFSQYRKLNKFATMGNAVTFPVETLLFLAIALAAVLTSRRQRVTLESIVSLAGEVAVFGDDIVVPKDESGVVREALETIGFKVNMGKSFMEGNFRESCGLDAFRGQEVTPVYLRRFPSHKPESVAATVALHNNLYNRFLLESAKHAASTLPLHLIARVDADSGVFGLQSRLRKRPAPKRRWNRTLHRWEMYVLSITSTQAKTPTEDDSALLQYFTEAPEPYTMWSSGAAQRPITRKVIGWVPMGG